MLLQSLSNFALFAEDSQSLTGMTLGGTKLYTIDDAGRAEIGSCLDPEIADLRCHIAENTAKRVHPDESTNAKGTREEPRDTLPEAWDGRLRPRDATQEE